MPLAWITKTKFIFREKTIEAILKVLEQDVDLLDERDHRQSIHTN